MSACWGIKGEWQQLGCLMCFKLLGSWDRIMQSTTLATLNFGFNDYIMVKPDFPKADKNSMEYHRSSFLKPECCMCSRITKKWTEWESPWWAPHLRMAERMLWSARLLSQVEDSTIFAFSTWRTSVVGGSNTKPTNAWDKDGQPKQGKDSAM